MDMREQLELQLAEQGETIGSALGFLAEEIETFCWVLGLETPERVFLLARVVLSGYLRGLGYNYGVDEESIADDSFSLLFGRLLEEVVSKEESRYPRIMEAMGGMLEMGPGEFQKRVEVLLRETH